MEDLLGGRTSPEKYSEFLNSWATILTRRVDQAAAALSEIEGVRGLILAGSLGRGEPWPLSDIDFLAIYDDSVVDPVRDRIERRRVALLDDWIDEGWGTGLDIGRLFFTRNEISNALTRPRSTLTTLLQEDRWYYSLDKGYRGRAIYDPDGLASALVDWITKHRFYALTVRHRLMRTGREVDQARHRSVAAAKRGDELEATVAIRSAANWLMTWQLEQWGERDTSFGRVGTRFERIAESRGRTDLRYVLRELNNLQDDAVQCRIAIAPGWVRERHDRSYRARRYVGENLTRIEDARDALRACVRHESPRLSTSPFPDWLGIPDDVDALRLNAREWYRITEQWLAGDLVHRPDGRNRDR